jgi:rubrerythrin
MVDFVTAIATATQAVKLVNDLRSVEAAMQTAESKLKIAELNGAIADLKNALVDAKAEAKSKEDEFKALEDNFLIFKETVEVHGFRYDKKEDGTPVGHPYCPVCAQKHGYMFHTTQSMKPGRLEECPSCKATYQATAYYD